MISFKKRRRYKYNLHGDFAYETGMEIEAPYAGKYLAIDEAGKLTIRSGYSWDGPSGPTFDTPNFMQGSLVHDALYQLMRERVLPQQSRKRADEILRDICIEDGMSKARAWLVYRGVRLGGASSARPDLRSAP